MPYRRTSDSRLQFAIRCPRDIVECQIITNDQESRLLRAIESRMRTAGEGGLPPCFRLASRSAAFGATSRMQCRFTFHVAAWPRGCNCASQTGKVFSASIQSARQATALKPDADCGRGKLFPRFRLASRSAASGDIPRSCNCASQTGKSLLAINSVRSARQSTRRFIPFNGSLCRETMGNLAGHQNTCERDTSRNRAHTAVHGRFCNPPGSQVGIGRPTCAQCKS